MLVFCLFYTVAIPFLCGFRYLHILQNKFQPKKLIKLEYEPNTKLLS